MPDRSAAATKRKHVTFRDAPRAPEIEASAIPRPLLPPRIYGPVSRSNQLATDEVFGPVLSILAFEDEADAIQLASGTEFGLMAGILCKNGSRSLRVARQIKAGQVYINAYGAEVASNCHSGISR